MKSWAFINSATGLQCNVIRVLGRKPLINCYKDSVQGSFCESMGLAAACGVIADDCRTALARLSDTKKPCAGKLSSYGAFSVSPR